jgi:PST family polysaccharide transporter
LLFGSAKYRPHLRWNRIEIDRIARYGFGFSASIWIWQLRGLVNPLIVGRFAGPTAMGVVALSIRIVEYLSFVKTATWRISIAALGRMQQQLPRLAKAVSEGMRLQVLALGPLLVAFAWIAPIVVPLVFGPKWIPALAIYPFIAMSYLANALFSMHSSALYVLRRNWDVTAFHTCHVVLFAGGAFFLVPQFGTVGYGLAELVAIPAYAVIHRAVQSRVGTLHCALALTWGAAFALALFSGAFGWWTAGGLALLAVWPRTWAELSTIMRHLVWKPDAA